MAKRLPKERAVLLLGALGGLFALVQVFISVAGARANEAFIRTVQLAIYGLLDGGGADPTPALLHLVPLFVATYLSIALAGAITLLFCWYAGRLYVRHGAPPAQGSGLGMQVMLISGAIWIAGSIVAVLLWQADGTITGVLTAFRSTGLELAGLVLQELLFGLIGLGFGALIGQRAARSAAPPPWPPFTAPFPPSGQVRDCL